MTKNTEKRAFRYALNPEDIRCPNHCECPIIPILNEKLAEISRHFEELEKMKSRKLLSGKELLKAKDIRHIREKYTLTQQDLAYILEVNVATVNRWENGKVIPSDKIQKKLYNLKKLSTRKVKVLLAQKTPSLEMK